MDRPPAPAFDLPTLALSDGLAGVALLALIAGKPTFAAGCIILALICLCLAWVLAGPVR